MQSMAASILRDAAKLKSTKELHQHTLQSGNVSRLFKTADNSVIEFNFGNLSNNIFFIGDFI